MRPREYGDNAVQELWSRLGAARSTVRTGFETRQRNSFEWIRCSTCLLNFPHGGIRCSREQGHVCVCTRKRAQAGQSGSGSMAAVDFGSEFFRYSQDMTVLRFLSHFAERVCHHKLLQIFGKSATPKRPARREWRM